MAWRFGASSVIDAYRVVLLLIIWGQQLFVTNVLPNVVVPLFAEGRANGTEADVWVGVDTLANILLGVGVLMAAVLFFLPAQTADLLAPGLVGQSRVELVYFVRWCGPSFIPICCQESPAEFCTPTKSFG